LLRLIISLPVLIVLVAFALSNREVVRLGLWPTDYALDTPLAVAVLVGMAVAFVLGALLVWFGALAARARARSAERQVRRLEAQIATLQARVASPTLPLPPPGA
jgi:uncharacterized membrane protein YciS (DUF1049 family)